MTCEVCGADIPRGQRYKGKRYSSVHFCSQECYDEYLHIKEENKKKRWNMRQVVESGDKTEYRKFTDLLNDLYPEEYQNWSMFQQQASKYIDDFDLDYSKLRGIIVFAVRFEGHSFNPAISLTQFFPRYIEPFNRFVEQLNINRNTPMEEIEIAVKKNKDNRTNYNVKAVDF